MKKALLLHILLFFTFALRANNFIETEDILSDDWLDSVNDSPIIRQINGGTVIIPANVASSQQ